MRQRIRNDSLHIEQYNHEFILTSFINITSSATPVIIKKIYLQWNYIYNVLISLKVILENTGFKRHILKTLYNSLTKEIIMK